MLNKYNTFGKTIPDDRYEVISIVQDADGTHINLSGYNHELNVGFGFVKCLCICDEGARIESYNKIEEIQQYRKLNFYGNPFYTVNTDSGFTKWLERESCGFSRQDNHYAIITENDFIDVIAPFEPQITTVVRKK